MGTALVTTAAAPAHAGGLDRAAMGTFAAFFVTTIAVAAIGDLTFAIHDTVVAGQNELPSRGWAIVEMVHTIPQTRSPRRAADIL